MSGPDSDGKGMAGGSYAPRNIGHRIGQTDHSEVYKALKVAADEVGDLRAKLDAAEKREARLDKALRNLLPRYEHLCSVLVVRDSTWAIQEEARAALADGEDAHE